MHTLFTASHNGILGVMCIESGKSGPVLGIGACTHGGEVVGLDIIDFLIEKLDIKNKLKCGTLFFSLNNIPAYQKYLETGDVVNSRFVEENLNRACSIENMKQSNSPEIQRARQLEPILADLDIYLDIHSTYSPSESISIFSGESFERFGDVLNASMAIVGINEKLVGKPFMNIVERHGGLGLGLEAGNQFDEQGYKIGVDNVLRLLLSLDMIETDVNIAPYIQPKENTTTFLITDTIVVKNQDFRPVRQFFHGEMMETGELIAFDGEKDIRATEKIYIIMPAPKKMYERCIGEEFCFLGQKI